MSEEFIKNLLGNINYEVETDTNWVEPLGFDRDTWKALLKYIQQKENIIKEVKDLFYEKCRLKDSNGRYSFNEVDIDDFRNLLDKGE